MIKIKIKIKIKVEVKEGNKKRLKDTNDLACSVTLSSSKDIVF